MCDSHCAYAVLEIIMTITRGIGACVFKHQDPMQSKYHSAKPPTSDKTFEVDHIFCTFVQLTGQVGEKSIVLH